MEPKTLVELLQLVSGGTVPAMIVVIYLLWKQDKRLQTLELRGEFRDKLLAEIKRKLDTVLTGFNFGSKDDGT